MCFCLDDIVNNKEKPLVSKLGQLLYITEIDLSFLGSFDIALYILFMHHRKSEPKSSVGEGKR